MGKKKRMQIEEKEKRVPDIRTMVMYHKRPDTGKIEQRCPYCKSLRLRIIDYDVADENEKRFGMFKFIKKCNSCKGLCKHIGNI